MVIEKYKEMKPLLCLLKVATTRRTCAIWNLTKT